MTLDCRNPSGFAMTPLLVIATAIEVWRVAIQTIQKDYTTTGLLRHFVPRKDKTLELPRYGFDGLTKL
jgi:hypothetical protein